MTIAECAVQLVIDNWPSRNAKRCTTSTYGAGTSYFAREVLASDLLPRRLDGWELDATRSLRNGPGADHQ